MQPIDGGVVVVRQPFPDVTGRECLLVLGDLPGEERLDVAALGLLNQAVDGQATGNGHQERGRLRLISAEGVRRHRGETLRFNQVPEILLGPVKTTDQACRTPATVQIWNGEGSAQKRSRLHRRQRRRSAARTGRRDSHSVGRIETFTATRLGRLSVTTSMKVASN